MEVNPNDLILPDSKPLSDPILGPMLKITTRGAYRAKHLRAFLKKVQDSLSKTTPGTCENTIDKRYPTQEMDLDRLMSRLLGFSGTPFSPGGGTTRDCRLPAPSGRRIPDKELFQSFQAKQELYENGQELFDECLLWGRMREVLVSVGWLTYPLSLLLAALLWTVISMVARLDSKFGSDYTYEILVANCLIGALVGEDIEQLLLRPISTINGYCAQAFEYLFRKTTNEILNLVDREELISQSEVLDWYEEQFWRGRKIFSGADLDRQARPFVGWCPNDAQPGDVICLFENYALPFCVRRVRSTVDGHRNGSECQGGERWELLGSAFVLDHMHQGSWKAARENVREFKVV